MKQLESELSRRDLLVAGLGLAMTGCAAPVREPFTRPRPPWPTVGQRPTILPTPPAAPDPPEPVVAPPQRVASMSVIPRSHWAKSAPIYRRLRPMGQINRITVHHEGWQTVYFTDMSATLARMESIRKSHLDRLSAGDIGYHYIIDRAGRLLEGRDIRFQGAHVLSQNPHNVGVMVLGNFNRQKPSSLQYESLNQTLRWLIQNHRVASNRVYTHRELGPTSCPGAILQDHMVKLRRHGIA